MVTINKDTFHIWHLRLGHLGHQNIIQLAHISEGIDLSKTLCEDVYIPYIQTNM